MKPPSFTQMPFAPLLGREGLLLWVREHMIKCNVQGSYFEFGVLNGMSMEEAYYILRDSVEKYIGFDSFTGLSELTDEDAKAQVFQPEFFKGNYCSAGLNVVKNRILSSGIAKDRLELYEGFFEQSLTKVLQKKLRQDIGLASVVHLDVDLHSSTKLALEFIYPFLQTGTWLLCDDYWTYRGASSCGTQKALKEFLKDHPDILIQEYSSYRGWSKAFIVECLEDSN